MEIWTGYLRSKTVLYHNAHKIHTAFLSFSNRRSLELQADRLASNPAVPAGTAGFEATDRPCMVLLLSTSLPKFQYTSFVFSDYL